ncbi:hypothetical protein NAEGRDRAFT_79971 [Naegleria gruberi]|uniref:RGS domain-containing protein n=1 Tax=Naegleria gruberi TaxID=5762 RepID=D2VH57_NAEGR|nr:uncharacterized protein NAEGRDRAFT_79971 [Naegleria gruberi]EFC43921.1 hypothetical protein NAEGRDRAFT_79971 [Naegleria gruberi]|eukprot:XP_002676665.1 hypothetical protein NAEGRDRAFT_79971 [Naegleria gruberi strain NEG-M]
MSQEMEESPQHNQDDTTQQDNDDNASCVAVDEMDYEAIELKDEANFDPTSPKTLDTTTADMSKIQSSSTNNNQLPMIVSQNTKKLKRSCNYFRIITLGSLFFNIIAFFALIGLTINTYLTSNNTSIEILIARGDAKYFNTVLWDTMKWSVLGRDNSTNSRFTSNLKNFKNSFKNILTNLPTGFKWTILNGTDSTSNVPMFPYYEMLMNYTKNNQFELAQSLFYSAEYQAALNDWNAQYEKFHQSVTSVGQFLDDYVVRSSIANLIIISISLIIIIPVTIVVFIMMVRKDGLAKNTLQSLNSQLLAETMKDPTKRQLFREHCEKNNMGEQYSVLEKCIFYRECCELIAKLPKKGSTVIDETQKLEKTKIEIAFEILGDMQESTSSVIDSSAKNYICSTLDEINNTLNVRSDMNEINLPSSLFEVLEKEIQDQMLFVHYVFKKKK